MMISSASYTPLFFSSKRTGLLLFLHTKESIGIGEISPLPGESKETIEEAKRELFSVLPLFIHQPCTPALLEQLDQLSLFPSVYFGLQGALFSLLTPSPPPVSTYFLLQGKTKKELLAHAISIAEKQKNKEIKLKIGSFTFKETVDFLEKIAPFSFRLRLDCNQKWPFAQTKLLFDLFYHRLSILYVEEPVLPSESYADFPYPFALDETIRKLSLQEISSLSSIPMLKACIIKPTLSSPLSFLSSLDLSKVVITSSFESPQGVLHLQRLIHLHNLIDHHHGLTPHPRFL